MGPCISQAWAVSGRILCEEQNVCDDPWHRAVGDQLGHGEILGNTGKSVLFFGHLILCISRVGQSTNFRYQQNIYSL